MGFDLRNQSMVDLHWATITNTVVVRTVHCRCCRFRLSVCPPARLPACLLIVGLPIVAGQIEINQDYAGHSGSQFAQSAETVTLHACDWKAGVSCDWPKWTAWHKPLSRRDTRMSTNAVLLMNNDYEPARLSFSFADIPGMPPNTASCELYDVWGRKSLGVVKGPQYTTTEAVPSHDSAFITLGGCTT
eukprot:COSAG02_NODE_3152_length_7273_cov_30.318372_4_plen_188_part_00